MAGQIHEAAALLGIVESSFTQSDRMANDAGMRIFQGCGCDFRLQSGKAIESA